MPIFFQHQINDTTRLGIWKIEETEEFFQSNVPQHRDVTHPQKRLQHLAGRFLLQYLFPGFPYQLVEIAETRKPYLPGEQYHFSISHCGDYAAAIVSKNYRCGVDIETPTEKIFRVKNKFLSNQELDLFGEMNMNQLTLLWSVKEAVFKWYGEGSVDFREHIHLSKPIDMNQYIPVVFTKIPTKPMRVAYTIFEHIVLTWVIET
jgi:phosphopantetheinyl transferase